MFEDKVLTRLLPNQIAEAWSIIRDDALDYLPGVIDKSNGTSTNILSQMMLDKVNLWIFFEGGHEGTVDGFAITSVFIDELSGHRSLLVYLIKAYTRMSDKLWIEVLNGLRSFAISRGCSSVIGFTKSQRLADVIRQLGGNVEYSLTLSTNGAL